VRGDSGHYDIFVHDRSDGSIVRASVTSAGLESNGTNEYPHLSGDGRYVAFESTADNLVPGDTNQSRDVFVRDLVAGTIERVSIDSSGLESAGNSFKPRISDDGRWVVFESVSSHLVPGDENGWTDVFVRDRQAGTTVRASVNSSGREGNHVSMHPRISADGRYVLFASKADNLVSDDTNFTWDVFLRDLQTGQTTRVSVGSGGVEGNRQSYGSSISDDGRYVAFDSYATNLVPGDSNDQEDCFVHDRLTAATTRVSVDSAGGQARTDSRAPELSADGRLVVFQSEAKDLVPVPSGKSWAVYLHDRETGVTTLESVSSSGVTGQRDSRDASMSADGRYLTFMSSGNVLVPDDLNGLIDVFARDRLGCTSTVVSFCVASSTSLPGCTASMTSTGTASLAAGAGFSLASGAIPGGGTGVLRFGVAGSSRLPLGTLGGLVCVDTPSFALPPKATGGTFGACDGSLGYTLAEMIASQPGVILPGSTVHASYLLRDRANPDGFATSNGIWFQVCP